MAAEVLEFIISSGEEHRMIKYFYKLSRSVDPKQRTFTNRITRTQFKKLFDSTPRSKSVWKHGTKRAISGFRCVRTPNRV